MREFVQGLTMVARALRYLVAHPSLIPWVLGPAVLTLSTVGLFGVLGGFAGPSLLVALLGAPTQDSNPLLWSFGFGVAFVGAIFLGVVVGWVVGNMASAPLYDVIAGRVESAELHTQDDDFSWRRLLKDASMSVRHSVAGLALYVAVMVPLFALNLVPMVGSLLYSMASIAATVAFVSREVMDVPLSRRQLSFADKLRYLRDHRDRIAGHGSVVALLLLIPLANIVVTPIAVLGATLLFCDIERQRT